MEMRTRIFQGDYLNFVFGLKFSSGNLDWVKRDPQIASIFEVKITDQDALCSYEIDPFSNSAERKHICSMLFLSDGNLAFQVIGNPICVWSTAGQEATGAQGPAEKLFDFPAIPSAVEPRDTPVAIECMVELPSGHIASGDSDSQIALWDLRTRRFDLVVYKMRNPSLSLHIRPNGDLVGFDREIYILDPRDVKNAAVVNAAVRGVKINDFVHAYSMQLEVLANGFIAVSINNYDEDVTVVIRDPDTKTFQRRVYPLLEVERCFVTPNNFLVVRICTTGTVLIFDLLSETEKLVCTLEPGKAAPLTIKHSLCHILLVHLNNNLSPINQHQYENRTSSELNGWIESVCRSADGNRVAVGTTDKTIKYWSLD